MKFKDFDWHRIAQLLGGSIRRATTSEAEIAVGTARYRVQDLKGDLVISVITPVAPHIGYDDASADGPVTEQTLAYRIGCVLQEKPIDYTLHLGPAVAEDEEQDDEEE